MGEATKRVRRRGEAGNALVLCALLVPVLLGFAALAIDVGYLYYVRTAMQATADAACLAGASGLLESEVESTARATAIGNQNIAQMTILANSGEPTTLAVSFPSDDDDLNIQTTVSNPAMRLFFGRIVGWTTAPVSATATCGLSAVNAVTGSGIIPLAVYCPVPVPGTACNENRPWKPGHQPGTPRDGLPPGKYVRVGCGMYGGAPCAGPTFKEGEDDLQAVYFTRDWSAKDIGYHIDGSKVYTETVAVGDLLPIHGDQTGNFNGVLFPALNSRIGDIVVVPEVAYYSHQGAILDQSQVIGFYAIRIDDVKFRQSQIFVRFTVVQHIVSSPGLVTSPDVDDASPLAPMLLS